jgi:hypothetical protein
MTSYTNRNSLELPEVQKPYVSNIDQTHSVTDEELAGAETEVLPRQNASPLKAPRFKGIADVYLAVSWIFGFNEMYSLVLCA